MNLADFCDSMQRREKFPYAEWARAMRLGDPVGINGFYSSWEPDYCEKLHAQLGYTPPQHFRSPRQQLEISLREKNLAIEKAKTDLYEDMALSDILPPYEPRKRSSSLPTSIALHAVFHDGPGSHVDAKDGIILSSSRLKNAPQVSYKWRSGTSTEISYFTLVLSDPDCPSRVAHNMREFVHWAVINIPGDRICDGCEVLPYVPIAPPPGSGLHRFVFMLFQQYAIIEGDQLTECKDYFKSRCGLRTHEFLTSLRDPQQELLLEPTPVAVDAFLSEWSSGIENVYKAVGVSIPSPYNKIHSPKQIRSTDDSPFTFPMVAISSESIAPQSPKLSNSPTISAAAVPEQEQRLSMSHSRLGSPPLPVSPSENKAKEFASISMPVVPSLSQENVTNIHQQHISTTILPQSSSSMSRSPSNDSTADSVTCSSDDVIPNISSTCNNDLPLQPNRPLGQVISPSFAAPKKVSIATHLTEDTSSALTVNAVELCKVFDIKSPSFFEGGNKYILSCLWQFVTFHDLPEMMKKKFSTDFLFKDSFIWINSTTKSLHW